VLRKTGRKLAARWGESPKLHCQTKHPPRIRHRSEPLRCGLRVYTHAKPGREKGNFTGWYLLSSDPDVTRERLKMAVEGPVWSTQPVNKGKGMAECDEQKTSINGFSIKAL